MRDTSLRFLSRGLTLISFLALGLVLGCTTTDLRPKKTYDLTRDAQKSSLALMAKAHEPFGSHAAEVSALRAKLLQAQAYAADQLKDPRVDEAWRVTLDPKRDLLIGFLSKWEQQGSLHAAFVEEKQKEVSDAFDQICALEYPALTQSNKP